MPFKETSLKIGGGSLTVYNSSFNTPSSTLQINNGVVASYLPPFSVNTNFTPGELRYESVSAQTDISLQNGAVVMRPRVTSGSVMLAEPRWFYDSTTNTMVINLINITSTELMAKEGIGTVQMMLVGEPYYNETFVPVNQNIILIYTPDATQDYSVAWDNYFKKTFTNQPGLTLTLTPSEIPGTGVPITYTLKNTGSSDMALVIKIFEVKIKSI